MVEYACICMNKQNSEYVRILNVSDAVHKVTAQIIEQSSRQRRIHNTVKHLKWSILQEEITPECKLSIRNFSGQRRLRGNRALR